jgi:hypothetical protein
MVGMVSSFSFDKVIPKREFDKKAKKHSVVEISTKEGLKIKATLYKLDNEIWAEFDFSGKEGTGAYSQIHIRSKGWVYRSIQGWADYYLESFNKAKK